MGVGRDDVVSKHLIRRIAPRGTAKAGSKVLLSFVSNQFTAARDMPGISGKKRRRPRHFMKYGHYQNDYTSINTALSLRKSYRGHKTTQMTALCHDARGSEWIDMVAS